MLLLDVKLVLLLQPWLLVFLLNPALIPVGQIDRRGCSPPTHTSKEEGQGEAEVLSPLEAQRHAKQPEAQTLAHPRAAPMAVPHAPPKSCKAQASPTQMSEGERQTAAGNYPAV